MIRGRDAVDAFAVGRLGFGGAMLGNLYRPVSDADALGAVAAAIDGGIRLFDVAPHYGLGLAETRLGRALAGVARDRVVLSTKVGRLLEPNPHPTGSDLAGGGFAVPDTLRRRFDFTAAGVRRSLDASRERLGTDRLDLVHLHDLDDAELLAAGPDAPLADAVAELRDQQRAGLVGAVGVGVNTVAMARRAVAELDLDVVLLAGRWTLLRREGRTLLDECHRRGIAVIAAAPYNSGLLARDRPGEDGTLDYTAVPPDALAEAARLADVCARHGVRLPVAALQFALRHPAVVTVLAGFADPGEVDAGLARMATPVPQALWAELGV